MKNLCLLLATIITPLTANQLVTAPFPGGSVTYELENNLLVSVSRSNLKGEVLYTHCYTYDPNGLLIKESLIGNLGEIDYSFKNDSVSLSAPGYSETIFFEDIRKAVERYKNKECHPPIAVETAMTLQTKMQVLTHISIDPIKLAPFLSFGTGIQVMATQKITSPTLHIWYKYERISLPSKISRLVS